MRSQQHKSSPSRQDEDGDEAQAAANPVGNTKEEVNENVQQIDDLLDDIDDLLKEIENPEQWVREYVQKGGQ